MAAIIPITRERVREYEMLQARCVESLLGPVNAIADNGQGYAFFERLGLPTGDVRATLSTNLYAVWATGAYGLTQADEQTLAETIAFFREHRVAPRVRIVPDGFDLRQAARLTKLGLLHADFHTIMHAKLPIEVPPSPADIRVARVTDADEYDIALDVQLEGWGMPPNPDSPLKKLRRSWRTAAGHHMYLAYLDGKPAAHAMLYVDDKRAYLENASTPKSLRNRGLHTALIRQRVRDAREEFGCDTVVGGADFESPSRVNQMRCGLQIAYFAALWTGSLAPP